MTRLRQTRLWRPHPRAALLGPIHPSCRHFQSPLGQLRWSTRHLPMEGLRTWEPEKSNDAKRYRVPASIFSPRSPQRIRAHSPLRLSGESLSLPSAGTWQETAGHPQFIYNEPSALTLPSNFVALPTLRRRHGHRPTFPSTRVAMAIFHFRFLMNGHPKSGLRRRLLPASPELPVSTADKPFPPLANAAINPIQPHSLSPSPPCSEYKSVNHRVLYRQNAVLSP
jgi:hypothetical protein